MTPNRKKFIDFTRPFVSSKLAALVVRPPKLMKQNQQPTTISWIASKVSSIKSLILQQTKSATNKLVLGVVKGSLAEHYLNNYTNNIKDIEVLPVKVIIMMMLKICL